MPLTYPFALTFPAVMSLVSGFDFPFAAMGSVHVENMITQYRPIAVTESSDVRCTRRTCASTARACWSTLITEVKVGNDVAWQQVTTFLHQQRTSLSDEPKPEPEKQPKLPPPNAICASRPVRSGITRRWDHNPIHTNSIGAKLFGFPR